MADHPPRRTSDTQSQDTREDDNRDNPIDPERSDWPGGSMGSEHESKVYSMRREAQKGTMELDRDRTTQDDAPPPGSQPEEERDASTRHLKVNEITEMDRATGKADQESGVMRTPEEKSLHDELGRALDDAKKRDAD